MVNKCYCKNDMKYVQSHIDFKEKLVYKTAECKLKHRRVDIYHGNGKEIDYSKLGK